MDRTAVATLFAYNYWANRRILEAAQRITAGQFAARTSFSFGSLHGTLVHLLDAERSWRELLQHNRMTFEWTEADFPTLDSVEIRWRQEESAMLAYLDGLSDEQLAGIVRYTTPEGERRERVLWHCLFHVINHAAQHRSEAAAMVTAFGRSPGDLDFTVFLGQPKQKVQGAPDLGPGSVTGEDIGVLYDYNYWSNARLLGSAARVTPPQFVAQSSFPRGSLRGTLVHVLDTEYGWLELLRHSRETPDLEPSAFPSVEALQSRWHEEEAAMRSFLADLSHQELNEAIRYVNPQGIPRERVRWHALFHVVNHGMQHRSEAAAMLTDFGQSPGELDFTMFLNENPRHAQV